MFRVVHELFIDFEIDGVPIVYGLNLGAVKIKNYGIGACQQQRRVGCNDKLGMPLLPDLIQQIQKRNKR